MNDWQLPPELESLERELAARSTLRPSADLRRIITSGVHSRLRREGRLDFWRFAAAAALVAAVWLNLSLSAARETNFHFQLADNRPSVEQTAREIQNLLPEMSETDARREALLLCAGSNLIMYPKITVPPTAINQILSSSRLLQ
jgi:anti-sigma-K factor RskA